MAKISLGSSPQSQQQPPQASIPTPAPEEPSSPPVSGAEFSAQSVTSSPADAPTHIDALIEGATVAETAATAPPAPVMIGADDFTKMFFAGFNVAHGVTGLQSLKIPEGDSGAVACAQALHETIMDIPALHFLLMPQGKWIPRIMAIAAFTVPVGRGVAAELHQRRRPAKPPNFSDAKRATRAASNDPDDPDPEALAALNAQ